MKCKGPWRGLIIEWVQPNSVLYIQAVSNSIPSITSYVELKKTYLKLFQLVCTIVWYIVSWSDSTIVHNALEDADYPCRDIATTVWLYKFLITQPSKILFLAVKSQNMVSEMKASPTNLCPCTEFIRRSKQGHQWGPLGSVSPDALQNCPACELGRNAMLWIRNHDYCYKAKSLFCISNFFYCAQRTSLSDQ